MVPLRHQCEFIKPFLLTDLRSKTNSLTTKVTVVGSVFIAITYGLARFAFGLQRTSLLILSFSPSFKKF